MRITTGKRRVGADSERLVAKQARRERLAFRLIERRVRWAAKLAKRGAV